MAYPPDPYYNYRRTSHHLSPDPPYGASLYRSRSHGHSPRPEINIYNEQNGPVFLPPSPDLRGRTSIRIEDLEDEVAALRLANSRSRSRARTEAAATAAAAAAMPWGYQQPQQAAPAWYDLQREQERLKAEYELKRLQDKANADRQKQHEAELIAAYEARKRDDKDKEKAAEVALLQKIEREKREKKEREDREWDEFLRIQKEKKEEEKAEKQKKEEELEGAMRERLREHGFTDSQIAAMIAKKKKNEERPSSSSGALVSIGRQAPVYPKVHLQYLDTETLRYFGIPYEYDVSFPTNLSSSKIVLSHRDC